MAIFRQQDICIVLIDSIASPLTVSLCQITQAIILEKILQFVRGFVIRFCSHVTATVWTTNRYYLNGSCIILFFWDCCCWNRTICTIVEQNSHSPYCSFADSSLLNSVFLCCCLSTLCYNCITGGPFLESHTF